MKKQPVKDDEKSPFPVYRGGGWIFAAWDAHVSYRYWDIASYRNRNLGFRIVRNKPSDKKS